MFSFLAFSLKFRPSFNCHQAKFRNIFPGGDGIPGMEISSSYFEKGEKTKRDYKFIPGERKDDSKRDKINNRAEN